MRATPRSLLVPLLVAAFALATPPAAAEPEASAERRVAELLEVSGMDAQLVALPDEVLQGFAGLSLPAHLREDVIRMARRAYAPGAVKGRIVARMADDFDPEAADRALAWLRSDRGRRITALEGRMVGAQAAEAVRKYGRSLGLVGAPASREALIARLDAAARVTELSMEAAAATTLAMALAVNRTSKAPLDPDQVGREVTRQLEGTREPTRQWVRTMMLYTYRELSDAELLAYVEFAESETGRWYHAAVSHAFVGALTESATEFGTSLGQLLTAGYSRQPL